MDAKNILDVLLTLYAEQENLEIDYFLKKNVSMSYLAV